ncbi:MAG: glycosyltransferase family 9 protein [Candidatus Ratteibacteria bacterium]
MKKILIIGPNYIGDVLFTTPAVRTIKLNIPESYIVYFIRKKYGAFSVIKNNPDIDKIIAYEDRMTPFYLFYKIKKGNFDIAFVFASGIKRALIPYLCGIKERVGYINEKRRRFKFLFTQRFEEPDKNKIHRVLYYKEIVDRFFGTKIKVSEYVYEIPEIVEKKIEEKIKNFKSFYPLICFHPFAGTKEKQWPIEYFIKLGELIKEIYPKVKILITGTKKKEEYDLCLKIYNSIKEYSVFLAGETTLEELISIYKNCNLLIIGDTGPLHLACAVRCNLISLFGGSSPEVFGPFGEGKFITIKKGKIEEIMPEEVINKIIEILK